MVNKPFFSGMIGMLFWIRSAAVGIFLVFMFTGWKAYTYFFTVSTPQFVVAGIEPGGTYASSIKGIIKGSDSYKVGRLSVMVDKNVLVENAKIGRRSFEYPFDLSIHDLSQGKHTLTVDLESASYQPGKTTSTIDFFVDTSPLLLAFAKGGVDAKVYQGRTLHVQFQANKKLKSAAAKVLSKTYPCFLESDRSSTYECFVPIECEEIPGEYPLEIEAYDLAGNKATLDSKIQVMSFAFKKQTLRIPPEKIQEENEIGLPEKELEAEIEELTKKSPEKKLWHGHFIAPIEIKDPKQITTDYGVIRATQERGLRQHKALDLYAMPKSVVWAPQDGVVVLKNRYVHSGNTIVIDHGWGVLSLIFHLDTFAPLEVGDKIKKGNPVGTLGKTGYATGHHVHWEMRVQDVAIDPMEWTKAHF